MPNHLNYQSVIGNSNGPIAEDEIGVRQSKLRIGNPKLPAIFSLFFW